MMMSRRSDERPSSNRVPMTPETRYAKSGDVNIACHVIGEFPGERPLFAAIAKTA